jgi:hypothetical protein
VIRGPRLVNVLDHCNLSCRACNHVSPVLPRRLLEPDFVAELYRSRPDSATVTS